MSVATVGSSFCVEAIDETSPVDTEIKSLFFILVATALSKAAMKTVLQWRCLNVTNTVVKARQSR